MSLTFKKDSNAEILFNDIVRKGINEATRNNILISVTINKLNSKTRICFEGYIDHIHDKDDGEMLIFIEDSIEDSLGNRFQGIVSIKDIETFTYGESVINIFMSI